MNFPFNCLGVTEEFLETTAASDVTDTVDDATDTFADTTLDLHYSVMESQYNVGGECSTHESTLEAPPMSPISEVGMTEVEQNRGRQSGWYMQ